MVIRLDRGFVWVPKPSYILSGSVLINSIEMREVVLDSSIERAVTDRAGTCTIKIKNKDGAYTNSFSKKDEIKIYADYESGTTQIFGGFIRDINPGLDKISFLEIKGYDWAGEALQKIVNKEYTTPTVISAVFIELITDFLPGHTTTNISTTGYMATLITPTFNNKKLLDCLKELMVLTGNNCCFYCDFNKDWHAFEKGSVFNLYEPIIYTKNLISIQTEDTLSDVATKITLYGSPQGGLPMMITVSDDPEGYGEIEEVIKDNNITTYEALVEKTNELLNSKKTSEIKGKSAIVRGMIGLSPGDSVYIFAPDQGLQGEFFIPEFTHDIEGGKIIKTTCKFQIQYKTVQNISTLIKDRIDDQQKSLDIENPNDLENSYNFTFDNDTNCNHSSTETSDGKLQLTYGSTTGTMTSNARTTTDLITQAELRINGSDLRYSTFKISADGGTTWEAITADHLYILVHTGKQLKVRVNLVKSSSTPDPSVDSLAVLYK